MFARDMNPSPQHDPVSERSETGLSLEVIGGIVLFFDFLILFFFPAGVKIGYKDAFYAVMGGVALLGLALIIAGMVVGRRY